MSTHFGFPYGGGAGHQGGTGMISGGNPNVNIIGGNGIIVDHWNGNQTISISDEFFEIKNDIEKIKERLCILDGPDPELLEKYESLKQAYEAYKIMERLI